MVLNLFPGLFGVQKVRALQGPFIFDACVCVKLHFLNQLLQLCSFKTCRNHREHYIQLCCFVCFYFCLFFPDLVVMMHLYRIRTILDIVFT